MTYTEPSGAGRSTTPARPLTTTGRPVSSATSRTTASWAASPGSTRPPGIDHSPRPGSLARCTSSSRPSGSLTTAPTHGIRAPLPGARPGTGPVSSRSFSTLPTVRADLTGGGPYPDRVPHGSGGGVPAVSGGAHPLGVAVDLPAARHGGPPLAHHAGRLPRLRRPPRARAPSPDVAAVAVAAGLAPDRLRLC